MLMTTDPGDLVLDPTCGSGTTAYVAEKWGRRWITCDTSRVAITLAKQRLMTASFDYFALRYPHEGLKGGFIYKTVPHVTLKSIANNPEIDAIYERLHPGIDTALSALSAALAATPPAKAFAVTEGARKGQKLALGRAGVALLEWEVPFDLPPDWPADRSNPQAPVGALVAAWQTSACSRARASSCRHSSWLARCACNWASPCSSWFCKAASWLLMRWRFSRTCWSCCCTRENSAFVSYRLLCAACTASPAV